MGKMTILRKLYRKSKLYSLKHKLQNKGGHIDNGCSVSICGRFIFGNNCIINDSGIDIFPKSSIVVARNAVFKIGNKVGIFQSSIIAPRQTPILMYINDYGNKLCFLAIAILGIFASVDVSCSIKRQWFLEWAGKFSIIIFITHFYYYVSIEEFLQEYQIFFNSLTIFFQFLLVTFSEFFIVWFVNKYLPFIIGNKKTFSRVQPQ